MATKKRPAGKTGSSTSRSRQQRQGQAAAATAPRNDGDERLRASLPGSGTDAPQPAPQAAEAPAVTAAVAEGPAPEQAPEPAAAAPEAREDRPEEAVKEEAAPAEEPAQAPAEAPVAAQEAPVPDAGAEQEAAPQKKARKKEEKKARTGKKRVKVAGPETADAARDWAPLPCEALLEHLLPGSPELEATRRHGQHVAHLAEQLFDQLQPLHGLDGRWLYRLRIACCLHDIGFASGRKGHHKKGMRIVEQDTSLALLPEDRSLVAQLVRYHRKAWPALRHRRFAALGKKDREALNKAAALIRMADALDYRHMEAVHDVAVDLQPGKVVLTLSGARDCAPEQDRLLVKGDLFMHIFGVELECVCPIL
ncbi:HD domain-containing protein [uncultured Desulfovibrio sp.]|uniref:HD domain-containing protein n=1 Tax=uncultured Desulfovibrio sp. TaxID=167968 RepID=UPI00266FBF09|nr:HD domain-containing protein [uncultured Desulfovibrio sp.]